MKYISLLAAASVAIPPLDLSPCCCADSVPRVEASCCAGITVQQPGPLRCMVGVDCTSDCGCSESYAQHRLATENSETNQSLQPLWPQAADILPHAATFAGLLRTEYRAQLLGSSPPIHLLNEVWLN